jgi:hypothetical protein
MKPSIRQPALDRDKRLNMKFLSDILIPAAIVLIFSCAQDDRFERIENDKLRVIGVRYTTAEYAPGDTISARVYFAGNAIVSVGDFSIAYIQQYDHNYIYPDEKRISLLDSTLWFPDSMQFRYVIPEDVFLNEKTQGTGNHAGLEQLVSLAKTVRVYGDSALPPVSEDTLNYLMQCVENIFARPAIFFYANSVNGTRLKVKTDLTIRYHSLFPDVLPVNNNPQVKWIAIYKVPSRQAKDFYPHSPNLDTSTTITFLYNEYSPESVSDTVVIDQGYTYFLTCNQGIDFHLGPTGDTIRDTTCDLIDIAGDGSIIVPEEYNYNWFFKNSDEVDEIKDSLIVLSYDFSGPGYVKLKPPVFTEMSHFKVWVVVSDFVSEYYSRPKGFAVGSTQGVFKFTDKYRKSVKSK